MKFGMLHLFESQEGRTEREIVREQIERMRDSVMPQLR